MDYFRFGQGGRVLVILPGLSVDSVMKYAGAVADAYAPMARDFTVCVFDRRKELPPSYTIGEMAEDTAAAVRAHAPESTVLSVLDSLTTEEAYRHLADAGVEKACAAYLMDRIYYYLNRRACPELAVQCMVYSNEWGLLGKTELAEQWLAETKAGRAP